MQSFEEAGKALGVAVEVTVPATVQGVSGMNEFIEADFGPELISLDSKSRYFVLVSPSGVQRRLTASMRTAGCRPILRRAANRSGTGATPTRPSCLFSSR